MAHAGGDNEGCAGKGQRGNDVGTHGGLLVNVFACTMHGRCGHKKHYAMPCFSINSLSMQPCMIFHEVLNIVG
jgi:hypothetical protein